MALDLFDVRDAWCSVLPEPCKAVDDEPVFTREDTREKKAYVAILEALRTHRPDQALPPPLRRRLEKMMTAVVEQEGASATLLRTLDAQPSWWDAVPLLLAAGANPNAFAYDEKGHTLNVLGVAAVRGHSGSVVQLLNAGADPLWRNHDWGTAAHAAARLSKWTRCTGGLVDVQAARNRLACVTLLERCAGVAICTDLAGEVPSQIAERAIAWVRDQPEWCEGEWSAEIVAVYRQEKMDFLVQAAPSNFEKPRAPRRRF